MATTPLYMPSGSSSDVGMAPATTTLQGFSLLDLRRALTSDEQPTIQICIRARASQEVRELASELSCMLPDSESNALCRCMPWRMFCEWHELYDFSSSLA